MVNPTRCQQRHGQLHPDRSIQPHLQRNKGGHPDHRKNAIEYEDQQHHRQQKHKPANSSTVSQILCRTHNPPDKIGQRSARDPSERHNHQTRRHRTGHRHRVAQQREHHSPPGRAGMLSAERSPRRMPFTQAHTRHQAYEPGWNDSLVTMVGSSTYPPQVSKPIFVRLLHSADDAQRSGRPIHAGRLSSTSSQWARSSSSQFTASVTVLSNGTS